MSEVALSDVSAYKERPHLRTTKSDSNQISLRSLPDQSETKDHNPMSKAANTGEKDKHFINGRSPKSDEGTYDYLSERC